MSPAKIVAASPTTTKRLPLNAADFRFRAGAGGATSAGPEVQLSVSPASLGDWRTGTELGPAGPSSVPVLQSPRLAGDTDSWTSGPALVAPPAPARNLKSAAFSGSRFVVVGDAATIFAGDINYT